MKKSTTSSVLIGCCGLLTLLLWYFSQESWSHFSSTVGIRESSDTRTWYSNSGDQRIGANYYFGGSFVLVLAAGWLITNALRHENDTSLAGLVSLGVAGLAVIALGRWFAEFTSQPDSEVTRYSASGHVLDDAAVICSGMALALGALGIVIMVVGRTSEASVRNGPAPSPE